MPYQLTWLADVLRAAGLNVVEEAGWKDRGRGDMGTVRGILCHHTAGPSAARQKSATPSLKIIRDGREGLPGPLSQLYLARDGTWHVVAAGRCNHAGAGSWQGVTAGNSQMIGIEAENAGDGHDPWPEAQMDSYARGVAAILLHIGADDVMVAGHKEYATPRGRKIDPSFDMIDFREDVEDIMGENAAPAGQPSRPVKPGTLVDPRRAMLRKGDRGNSVRELQTKLGITADGDFGPATDRAVRAFQAKHGLVADGLVGPATWAALG